MKNLALAAGAIALTATAAQAGGIDRSRIAYGTLFESGTYLEFGATHVAPKISGTYQNPAFGPAVGTSTAEMAGDYSGLSFAYKRDVTEKLAYGVFVNQPYGALANYTAGPYTGLNAKWDSKQIALLLKYKINPNLSVYGGAKYVRSQATINIPDALIRGGLAAAGAAGNAGAAALASGAPAGSLAYSASGPSDGRGAYILGAAYEKPEIALRVGLTYESGFKHKFPTTEFIAAVPSISRTATTTVKMPESITLDFQSGVAKDTLVFGSIRHSKWAAWEVRPSGYEALTGGNVTDFSDNVTSFSLGLGRKLNDQLTVFARAGYEKSNGGVFSRLSPTDGLRSFGIGGSFTRDNVKVTAGLEYIKLGDASDSSQTRFSNNKAVGFGMSVGYRF